MLAVPGSPPSRPRWILFARFHQSEGPAGRGLEVFVPGVIRDRLLPAGSTLRQPLRLVESGAGPFVLPAPGVERRQVPVRHR